LQAPTTYFFADTYDVDCLAIERGGRLLLRECGCRPSNAPARMIDCIFISQTQIELLVSVGRPWDGSPRI
jgi:hypothetical protein